MARSPFRLIIFPPRFLYALGLGRLLGRRVLLLSTTGRRTGLRRTVPLQYEWIEGAIWVASVRGESADWYRNLKSDPAGVVRIGVRTFEVRGETVTDPGRIADFLEVRLERHPLMVRTLLRLVGVGAQPDRASLEAYARRLALVILSVESVDAGVDREGSRNSRVRTSKSPP